MLRKDIVANDPELMRPEEEDIKKVYAAACGNILCVFLSLHFLYPVCLSVSLSVSLSLSSPSLRYSLSSLSVVYLLIPRSLKKLDRL